MQRVMSNTPAKSLSAAKGAQAMHAAQYRSTESRSHQPVTISDHDEMKSFVVEGRIIWSCEITLVVITGRGSHFILEQCPMEILKAISLHD